MRLGVIVAHVGEDGSILLALPTAPGLRREQSELKEIVALGEVSIMSPNQGLSH